MRSRPAPWIRGLEMWKAIAMAGVVLLSTQGPAGAQSSQVFDHLDELDRMNERLQERNARLERENRELRERLRRYEPVDPGVSGGSGSEPAARPSPGFTAVRPESPAPAPITPPQLSPSPAASGISVAGTIKIESEPRGAEVSTSLGSGCRTPCEMEIAADQPFAITFVHPGYEPATVDVQVQPGKAGASKFLPNPVFLQLVPAAKKKPPSQALPRSIAPQ
jgi:PEGA domain